MKIFTTFTFTLLMCSLALNYALVTGWISNSSVVPYPAAESLTSSNARHGYVDPFEVVRSRMDEGLEQVRN